jgi:hypothetical protein
MPVTYESIATTTLGSAAASVTFSSIPATYTDLVIVINAGASSNEDIGMRFNSDSGNNYSSTVLAGNGSTTSSGRISNASNIGLTSNAFMTTSLNQNTIVSVMNYSNTTTNKTALSRANNSANGVDAIVGLWRNTAAINTILLYGRNSGHNFLSGSTFTLYGIKAA